MYSAEQLAELEEYAGLFFSVKKCAVLLMVDCEQLQEQIKIDGSPAYLAYNKGLLTSERDVRKAVLDMAKSGSTEAQKLAMKYRVMLNVNNILDEY